MADSNILIGEIERLESCTFYMQNFLKTRKNNEIISNGS